MTHRAALVLSIVLTLVVGTGVLAGRDRLFASESVTSPVTTTSTAGPSPDENQAGEFTTTSPRIVTVTLPSTASSASTQARSERDERYVDREGDDHDGGDDERYEHEDEDDDD